MRLITLYLFIILLLTSAAESREGFWYVGAGGGATFLDDKDKAFVSIDEKSFTAKAYVGYRASDYLAFELEYAYLGNYDFTIGSVEDTAEAQSLGANIVVMYPLIWDGIELFTPLGLTAIKADYGIRDKTTGGYKFGFGVAYTPTKVFTMKLGVEANFFSLRSGGDDFDQHISSVYAALQYNF